jgi:hypothetical protein
MTQTPGTPEAALLAFVLVEELIDTLVTKGVLSATDRALLLERIAGRLNHDTRTLAEPSAAIVRKMITEKSLKQS